VSIHYIKPLNALNTFDRYFRQLQEISDSVWRYNYCMSSDADGDRSQVVDAEWEGTLAVAIQESKAEEMNAKIKAKAGKAR
jgi:hypothetical protein